MLLRSFLHKDDNIFGCYLWYMKRQYFFLKFVILLTDLLEIFFHMCLICVSKTFIVTWEIGYSPVVYSSIRFLQCFLKLAIFHCSSLSHGTAF